MRRAVAVDKGESKSEGVFSQPRTIAHSRPVARTNRAAQDTAAGCRLRADADLLAAVATSTDNQRRRLETSAASWMARAMLLQAMDDDLEARKSLLYARCATKAEAR